MNAAQCQQALDGVAAGVAASLRAVDCAAGSAAQVAFGRLFGADGALVSALTILLTLYVAFFAIALITGRSPLGVSALTPRMMTVGLVLTFATSWIAYQGVVWNLAVGAPDQLAALLTGVNGSATQVFAEKIDVVFAALVDSSGSASPGTAGTGESAAAFSPPGLLWLGATLLLLGTVGVLATSKIALAVLLALGPVFVVMALFPATRGLFAGWLKGVVLLALAPLFAVLGGSLMLDLSVPVLRRLAETPGQVDPQAAMAFFMIGAVHVALMLMVLKIAGTMVGGWIVFGASGRAFDEPGTAPAATAGPARAPVAAIAPAEPYRAPASARSRQIRPSRSAFGAANDAAIVSSTNRRSAAIGAAAQPAYTVAVASSLSRARGIGSRFRAPPVRFTERQK